MSDGPTSQPAEDDERDAQRQLFAALYDELRRLAQSELQRYGSPLTIGPTTLLHEAYLNLCQRRGIRFPDRPRFLGYASRVMRGLVIDYARSRRTLKRGSGFAITELPIDIPDLAADCAELERLSDAIDRLCEVNTRLAEVVDLKYFSGFSLNDIASLWGVSERTVQRDWEKARLLLYRFLSDAGNNPQ